MRRKDGIVALLFIVGLCVGWLLYPAGVAAQTFTDSPSTLAISGSGCYDFAIGAGDSRLFYRQWDCGTGTSIGDVATTSALNTDGNASSVYSTDTDSGNGHVTAALHTANCPSTDSCIGDWTLFDATGQFKGRPTAFQVSAASTIAVGLADNDIKIQLVGLQNDVWETRYDLIGGNACTTGSPGTGTAGFCGGNTKDPFVGDGVTTGVNAESNLAKTGTGRPTTGIVTVNCAALSRTCVGRYVRNP